MKRKIAGVSDEPEVLACEEVSDFFFERWLWFRGSYCIMVPWLEEHGDVVWYVGELFRESLVLIVDVADGQFFFLVWVNADAVDQIPREDEIF